MGIMVSAFQVSNQSMAGIKFLVEVLFLCFVPLLVSSQEDSADPVVSTLIGRVSGLKEETSSGTQYYSFLGIPYAETPIEKLRFKDPMAKQAWSGLLNATEFPQECLQKTFNPDPDTPPTLAGSEDCLYLNIYTPILPKPGYKVPKSLKPVMFWIHGGGFTLGDGKMDPSFLLDEDVLVVAVNYRLGPFGFLALEGNPDLAGNIGLKDQQEALQWVNKNIIYFGGDPAKVTLFGESAGAVSVHAHVLSPRIKNIFQGAILQSGTALMKYEPVFMGKEVHHSCKYFLEKIGCNVTDVMKCLQGKDVETLMEMKSGGVFNGNDDMEESDEETFYWIVQDFSSPSPALPYNPLQQLTVGNFKKVPLILGITKDDGGLILLIDPRMKEAFEENNTTLLMNTLGLATYYGSQGITDEKEQIVNVMKRFYLSEGSYDDNEKNLIDMATDSWFGSCAAEVSKLHQKFASVFPYILNERCSDFSFASFYGAGSKDYGVSHADDLNCLFKPAPIFGSISEAGQLTSKAMLQSWTNFAKYEDPSPYLSSEPAWPKGELMFFEEESGLKKNESQLENILARMLLWDKMYWEPLEDTFDVVVAGGKQNVLTYILPYNWFHSHN